MLNTRRFVDKVVIITGAGDGIGYQTAKSFADEGAIVIIAEIDPTAGIRAEKSITQKGGRALFMPVDVSDEQKVETLIQDVLKIFGKVDILINNAGVVVHKLVVELTREEWNRQIDVQLTGPFLMSKYVARHFIKRNEGGKIVNISSVSAVMGRHKASAHCASKAGLTMLTKVLAMELGSWRVNVNAVAPGLIDVPSQRNEANISSEYKRRYIDELPLGRIGEVDDITHMVLFLCSDEASWITGQLILVDGGLMAGHYTFKGQPDFTMLDGHH